MKQLDDFIVKYNLETKNKVNYGEISGYHVFAKVDAYAVPACIGGVFVHLAEHRNDVLKFIKDNQKEFGILSFNVADACVTMVFKAFSLKSAVSNLEKALVNLTGHLIALGIDGSTCCLCGNSLDQTAKVNFGEFEATVCLDCSNKIEEENQKKEEEYKNTPNNYGLGTLGAFLGAIVGGVAWVIIGLFGWVSSLIAILISFLAGLGYDLFKGKQSKMKLVIISVVSILTIVLSMFILYAMIYENFILVLQNDPEVMGEFGLNMLMALLFGILGIGYSIYRMKGKVHK